MCDGILEEHGADVAALGLKIMAVSSPLRVDDDSDLAEGAGDFLLDPGSTVRVICGLMLALKALIPPSTTLRCSGCGASARHKHCAPNRRREIRPGSIGSARERCWAPSLWVRAAVDSTSDRLHGTGARGSPRNVVADLRRIWELR